MIAEENVGIQCVGVCMFDAETGVCIGCGRRPDAPAAFPPPPPRPGDRPVPLPANVAAAAAEPTD